MNTQQGMNKMDEIKLVRKSKKGNNLAFSTLIKAYEKDLYKVAIAMTKNEEDALDCIQEAILQSYISIKDLRQEEYFKTWLIKILINNVNMKNRHYNKFQDEPVEDYIGEIEYSNIEENIDLYDAIDRLDEKYKTSVILQYFHDLTISQIAEIMECNENTVKSNIRRAKKKLYDILKEEK